MDEARTFRVAAAQFEVGRDRKANLAACVRAIDAAAEQGAILVVLPEFCNHLSWYDDREQALTAACRPEDDFLAPVAERAAHHGIYVKLHVTLASGVPGAERITAASLLYGPDGVLAGAADKQVLMGSENDHLDPAADVGPVIDTALGPVGLYSCMEGVIHEVCRGLALRGAHVLLNSLNSFALDEAALHIPVRAAENKVWVIAANKVGPLLPADRIGTISAAMGVPPEALDGAGESQIVAPDGRVVAKGPRRGEALVVADIRPADAADKRRRDGTDAFAVRRPALYLPIASPPTPAPAFAGSRAEEVVAAVVRPAGSGRPAVEDAARLVRLAAGQGARLIVLPELFWHAGGVLPDRQRPDPQDAQDVLGTLRTSLEGSGAHLAFTLPLPTGHAGVLLDRHGPVLTQHQLHDGVRHRGWARAGTAPALLTHDTPWGRVAVVLGDDSVHPEILRLAALRGVDTVAVCLGATEPWEPALGLPERAAENRMNLVAAGHGCGALHALPVEFGLWRSRDAAFDGTISTPASTPAGPGLTLAPVRPRQAEKRLVSRGTDLVDGRPWKLLGALVAPRPSAPVAHPRPGQ
ncbi:carbon-nitrogen hydrolase family protein [Streptomyces sp. NBC_00335]|uniref:carbon-nitrogen hydrolase family protein n=1 Tax=unclassified Streptomyces TaxID=2593676 RepID=UPI00224DC0A1|nr:MULTISPECIES: carbon-nitrogen hydrolase family protein [unclassified Streptomyces]MCX5410220.1 carbon-nitrogen hydrolase family protein [Streptomyces sp. NBC_00086]